MPKFRPKGAHTTPPAAKAPPDLAEGQERRWLTARPQESRDEALARARSEMPWGSAAIGVPTLGRGRWVFTINARPSDA